VDDFDIFAFGTQSLVQHPLEANGYTLAPIEKLKYSVHPCIIFLSEEKIAEIHSLLNKRLRKVVLIVIGSPTEVRSGISFLLREDFTETEFRLALAHGKNKLRKNRISDYEAERNALITSQLSGNIHDVFSFLNNVSARIQFLEMIIKDNSHIEQTAKMSIEQTRKITKVLRNLQTLSKANLDPSDHDNIKVKDLLDNILTLCNYKFIRSKSTFNINQIDEAQYFTGCNHHILFLYLYYCLDMMARIAGQNEIIISSAYSSDYLHLYACFKPDISFPIKATLNDFIQPETVDRALFYNFKKATQNEIEIHTEQDQTQILLRFPKGV